MSTLGWTPGSFDSWNVLHNLHGCPNIDGNPIWNKADRNKIGRGKFNLGGYCNTDVDALTAKILSETDQNKRAKMISDAWATTIGDLAHIPLHQQALSWGVRDGVDLVQRAVKVVNGLNPDLVVLTGDSPQHSAYFVFVQLPPPFH